MTAYALAHVHSVEFGPDIVEYLERIDATLEPFGGRFLVHGGEVEVLEGSWGPDLIVIEFPDREAVRAWYDSPAYQEILALRTRHMVADAIIAQGVPAGYRGADALKH
ncbi:DUF1330 domain-containing protein [Streptomyces sp. CB01881]|uniref:DUF1330 domain-containing protein n=1 Tax=Streptomyces sp. CB01881 TaxID=2078691 RepID=UPI000CDCA895|nr:DUF1330 domain-containing protein [Streptomyces sp. CB01881]AUY47821.1 DUF1330 domain-containing protein [Streptomyces sp. CB01881]TYC76298.1 DUF1330 domain-containing protein [Streptomyces sp. CB01881]